MVNAHHLVCECQRVHELRGLNMARLIMSDGTASERQTQEPTVSSLQSRLCLFFFLPLCCPILCILLLPNEYKQCVLSLAWPPSLMVDVMMPCHDTASAAT